MKSSAGDNAGKLVEYTVIASAKRRPESYGSSNSSTHQAEEISKRVKSASPGGNLFPLFTRKIHKEAMDGESASLLKWQPSHGKEGTCILGTSSEPFARELERRKSGDIKGKAKIACFDLDGCIVNPKNGKSFPSVSDEYDFEEAFKGSFARVKQEYESGSCIAIVSNQKQSTLSQSNRKIKTWKAKLELIAQAIDCPLIVFAALTDDGFRKPGRLIWDHGIVPAYIKAGGKKEDIDIVGAVEEQASFFVGDAAGRVGDHSDTDRKWAINVGIPFFTPEEYFLNEKPRNFHIKGYIPPLSLAYGVTEPLPSNFFPSETTKLDLVLFVGPPAAGKTTFYKNHFSSRGYQWVNQDTLKTAAKCLSTARAHLMNNYSVVIDNTNRNKATRAPYITLAKELNANVRCLFFDVSHELCVHNSLFRVRAGLQSPEEERKVLPELAFLSYFKNVEPPSKSEGFDADVVKVVWSFQGDAEAKRRWMMYWQ